MHKHSLNVQGVKFPEQIEVLVHGFFRRGLFAARLQETWREGSEQLMLDGIRIISIGPEKQTGCGSQGVAIPPAWKRSNAGKPLFSNYITTSVHN